MFISHREYAGQNHHMKLANNVTKLKYLGETVTKFYTHEETKNTLNSMNDCYHSVQNIFPSHLLPKSVKIKVFKTVSLPVVFMHAILGLLP
jgi:23S rRNA U2552 (ribose-2'-O)-methylase RlmE/FtsJ